MVSRLNLLTMSSCFAVVVVVDFHFHFLEKSLAVDQLVEGTFYLKTLAIPVRLVERIE